MFYKKKTFLNYVADVYMYLKVVGAFLIPAGRCISALSLKGHACPSVGPSHADL